MKRIYICEDNEQQLYHINQMVADFLSFRKWLITPEIYTFTTPQDLLTEVQNHGSIGLYLLDVDLKNELNGIELAEKIRQFDPRGFIIFITTHDEYMPLTFQYRVEAFDYISKNTPNFRLKLMDALGRVFERYDNFHKTEIHAKPLKVKIKIGTTTHFINGYDIVCAKVSPQQHRIKIYTFEGTLEYYGSINDLNKELPMEQFFQCHRSAIINVAYLSSIDTKESVAHMRNGMIIPVATRKLEELKKHFTSILE